MRICLKIWDTHSFFFSFVLSLINDSCTLDAEMALGRMPMWEGQSSYISIPDRVWIETYLASC